ncbi:MAG: carbohydrate-binding domain-containing protein [Oscillospiraceae bacterium]|nr:carbohydrate-binding domain-containing protein [Oscillospiraceae bacterium]
MKAFYKISAVAAALAMCLLSGCGSTGDSASGSSLTATDGCEAEITFSESGAEVYGSGASASGSVVTITSEGTFVVSGECSDGQLTVAAGDGADVTLVLSGLTLTNSADSAVYAETANNVYVVLTEGTENVRTSGAETEITADAADDTASGGALQAKCDLEFSGDGSLTVYGYVNNGIQSSDDLAISSGSITVTAVNNGIKGKDSVTITGGTINVTCGNDGIKADNDTDSAKGWIEITGGDITVSALGDGISALTDLTVTGGTFDITSGDGTEAQTMDDWFGGVTIDGDTATLADGTTVDISDAMTADGGATGESGDAAPETDDGALEMGGGHGGMGGGGGRGMMNGGTGGSEQNSDGTVTAAAYVTTADTDDAAAPEMNGQLNGEAPADMPEMGSDAPYMNGEVPEMNGEAPEMNGEMPEMNGDMSDMGGGRGGMGGGGRGGWDDMGNLWSDSVSDSLAYSCKGIKCDGDMLISGGTFVITATDHAIHSAGTITVTGGTFDISSSAGKGFSAHGDLTIDDGAITITEATEGIESKATLTINGGTIDVTCSDDGLNAGGTDYSATHSVIINGGELTITAGGDGIDSNGDLTVNGGTTYVWCTSSGADSALDAGTESGGKATVNGGTILALGPSGMAESFSGGDQSYISYRLTAAAGDTLTIQDSTGASVFTATLPISGSHIVFSSSDIISGESYSVEVG